jgi:hypothetical protein
MLGMVLVVACEVPARAQIGFMGSETDGPGPFVIVQIPLDRLLCLVEEPRTERVIGSTFNRGVRGADIVCSTDGAGSPMGIRAHLSAEYAMGFSAPFTDTRGDFPELREMSFKPLVFFRLHENVDFGLGAAAHRFAGRDFDGTIFISGDSRSRCACD